MKSNSDLNSLYKLQDKDSDIDKAINEIANLLIDDTNFVADKRVKKQIFAFSHRELSESCLSNIEKEAVISELKFAGTLNSKQWWRKLALPSFVAGGFVLTVLAFQSLWQPLLTNKNDSYIAEVNKGEKDEISKRQIEVEMDLTNAEQVDMLVNKSASRMAREKYKEEAIAEFKKNRKTPDLDVRITDINNNEPLYDNRVTKGFIDSETKPNNAELELNNNLQKQNIYTGSSLSKSEYLEKDAWFKLIVSHLNKQEVDIANKEIVRFKSVYPDYKIEDKLKKLNILL